MKIQLPTKHKSEHNFFSTEITQNTVKPTQAQVRGKNTHYESVATNTRAIDVSFVLNALMLAMFSWYENVEVWGENLFVLIILLTVFHSPVFFVWDLLIIFAVFFCAWCWLGLSSHLTTLKSLKIISCTETSLFIFLQWTDMPFNLNFYTRILWITSMWL